MTSIIEANIDAEREVKRAKLFARINKVDSYLQVFGLSFITPILKAIAGDNPRAQMKSLWVLAGVPLISILVFFMIWGNFAPKIQTSLGAIPGPAQVWEQVGNLHDDYVREKDKEVAFYVRQDERNAEFEASGELDKIKHREYTGKPTFYKQIWTSLKTVFFGFSLVVLIAIPLGIIAGLSKTANAAINPFVQIFKPVSPLAWLPIVTLIISALVQSNDGMFSKSFLISAITVTLCSLWPTLINTSLGVASIDKDLISVGKVLKLSTWNKITKLVLPSALPLIFTGLRLSLGVGWMVLIAAEMLAQNPGLGKFVWDEFQNGSSQSLAKIMVAVFVIGIIGFILDRLMYVIQSAFTFTNNR